MNADAIRKKCCDMGISQNELSRRVGVSSASMSWYMNGKSEPKVSVFKRICEALMVKPEEIW